MLSSIRRNVAWRAIPVAGFFAGIVFLVVNMGLTALMFGISPRLFLQYAASLVLGQSALTDASIGVVVVGLVVHFALSLLFTFIISLVVHRWGLAVGIVGGAILGASFWGINFYTMTLFVPWFFAINSIPIILSHVLFGAVAGGVYEQLDTYDLPLEVGAK
jgi:hypothetical protein